MEIPVSPTLLTIIIMIIHTNQATPQRENDKNLIEFICKRTPKLQPLHCTTTLRAEPSRTDERGTADVAGLGLIMIKALEAKSKEALSVVRKLKTNPNQLAQFLQRCDDSYSLVLLSDVPLAKSSIREDPRLADGGMYNVVFEADSCGKPCNRKSPVNNVVRDLAKVARAIIRNLL